MAFKFLGQRQLGKLPSRWVSTILMVAIDRRLEDAEPLAPKIGVQRRTEKPYYIAKKDFDRKTYMFGKDILLYPPPEGSVTLLPHPKGGRRTLPRCSFARSNYTRLALGRFTTAKATGPSGLPAPNTLF